MSVQQFTQLDIRVDILHSFIWVVYLAWCDFVVDLIASVQISEKVGRRLWWWWDKRSGHKAWVIRMCFIGKVQTHWDQEMRDRRRTKSRAWSSFSSTPRGFFIKNSSWQAKQSIQPTTVPVYGDCMEICIDLAQILAVASWPCTVFHHGVLDQKQHACCPPSTLIAWPVLLHLPLVSQIKDTAILKIWNGQGRLDMHLLTNILITHSMELSNTQRATNCVATQ
jgi:hypothetical protein